MKKNNFILSFLSLILCICLLRFFWISAIFFIRKIIDATFFMDFIAFLSPFITYWVLKKHFSDSPIIQDLFLNYISIKKYVLGLFLLESLIALGMIFIGFNLSELIFVYLIYFIHVSCFLWYLPFLLMAYINEKKIFARKR